MSAPNFGVLLTLTTNLIPHQNAFIHFENFIYREVRSMRLPNVHLVIVCFIATVLILAAMPLPTSHADTFRPVVRGKRGVVAGGSPLSVEAGLRILRQGGNATDAGVATLLAGSVIECSHSSF